MEKINQMLDRQKAPHTPSYGVSFVNICEKIDHVVTTLHCTGE